MRHFGQGGDLYDGVQMEQRQLTRRTTSGRIPAFPETFDEHDTSEDDSEDERDVELEEVKKNASKRVYYLDWLRVIAIYLVVCYHIIVDLKLDPSIFIPSEARQAVAFQCLALQFGMPIFFHISGRAQAFARPTSLCAFMKSRTLRLALPFFPAWLLTIPVSDFCSLTGRDRGAPEHLFPYLAWYFTPENFRLNLGWLWFLPTLFLVGAIAGPTIAFAEGRVKDKYKVGYLIASALIWIVSTCILRFNPLYQFSWLYCLGTMTCNLVAIVLVILVPFPPHPSDQSGYRSKDPSTPLGRYIAVRTLTLMSILSQVLIVSSFRYADMPASMTAVTPVYLFFGYFLQGYCVQRWGEGLQCKEAQAGEDESKRRVEDDDEEDSDESDENEIRKSMCIAKAVPLVRMGNILIIGLQFLVILVSAPVGEWEWEIFPIYSASFDGQPNYAIWHVLGTWSWISVFVAMGIAFCDEQVDEFWYKHMTTSTIIVYIFHQFFGRVFRFLVILPMLEAGVSLGGWITMTFCFITGFVSVALSLGLYVLFIYVPCLGCLFGMG